MEKTIYYNKLIVDAKKNKKSYYKVNKLKNKFDIFEF